MNIEHEFDNTHIHDFSKQIAEKIANEPKLTNRSGSEIRNLMRKGLFYIAYNKHDQIIGFVAKRPIYKNYYEIMCWYVAPEHRKTHTAQYLLQHAVKNTTHAYLMSTFQQKIVKKTRSFGFSPISLSDLPWKVLVAYIMKRNIRSAVKHMFTKKSILIARFSDHT